MKKRNLFLTISIISLALFIITLLSLNNLESIDKSVSSFFISHQNQEIIKISQVISWIFEPINSIIIILIISVVLFIKNFKRESLLLSLTAIAAGILVYFFKEVIARIRPENMLIPETGFSFPSGHALVSVVLFGSLIYFSIRHLKSTPRLLSIIISTAMIIMIGKTRLILNVHWLSDVLAGYFLGLFLLFSFIYLLIINQQIYKTRILG